MIAAVEVVVVAVLVVVMRSVVLAEMALAAVVAEVDDTDHVPHDVLRAVDPEVSPVTDAAVQIPEIVIKPPFSL